MTFIERVAIAIASLALSVGLIALLTGFFTTHDRSAVTGPGPPGTAIPDLGDRLLRPGKPHPRYDSNPPTSGAHAPAPVTRDEVRLSDDQVLEALSLGDVVLVYGERRTPRALLRLAESLAGPFSPALAAAGQAVVLDRVPGTAGFVGLAWAHLIRVPSARDPRLGSFVSYWLGRGVRSPSPTTAP